MRASCRRIDENQGLLGIGRSPWCALWSIVAGLAVAATMSVAAEADRSSTTHLEFVAAWFPTDASSALHADVPAIARLASQLHGAPSHFASALETLDLIRNHVGFDHSQIERMTTATITAGAQGKVTYFTLLEPVPLDGHIASRLIPLEPNPDLIGGKAVYTLNAGGRVLGLYSPAGKHFILGDWGVFKTVLNGNGGEINQISKILEIHSAPIILGTNPRRQRKRFAEDAPFGTVVSIDFQDETLAFLMQEEHPTPDHAEQRLAVVEEEMPVIFRDHYGLTTKMGVHFHSFADGRHVVFGRALGCQRL